nr:FAD-dependent oxidoreductase [Leptospira perolatii]
MASAIKHNHKARGHRQRIAIVGGGIAGMGCAHFLKDEYEIQVFEKSNYVGGHTNTVYVEENGKKIPIDTGFIVFNHETYPNLKKLFEDLGVSTKKTSMSFSVQHVPEGLEYCGSGLDGLFAQRRNLLNPKFLRLLWNINRFNKEAPSILQDPTFESYSLERYIRAANYHPDLLQYYLIPMSSAVWSTPQDLMLQFPAYSLVRFFLNHGFLGLNTQHQWYTVVNGSIEYVKLLTASLRSHFHTNTEVTSVEKLGPSKVKLFYKQGKPEVFDKVVLAGHADQSLKILKNADSRQRRLLSQFKYQRNKATLHTDASVMPKTKNTWSSWNYRMDRIDGVIRPHIIYWMNCLQQVSKKQDYFVSIDDPGLIDPKKILKEIDYTHPLFHVGSLQAQHSLPELNANGPIYFCGSYFRYGFHEDALWSARILSEAILQRSVWK